MSALKSFDYFQDLFHAQSRITVLHDGFVRTLKEGVAAGIHLIVGCAQKGGKLIFVGNGGSAAIASHQSVDYWKNGGIPAIAFNDASLLTCIGNDYGYDRVFAVPIQRFAAAGDLLIAISSSGRSQNILQAAVAASENGCGVITLSGFQEDNLLRKKGKLNFYVPSDSYGIVEVLHLSILHAILDEIIHFKMIPPFTPKPITP